MFIVKLIIQICINRRYYMPGSANSPQNFNANLKIISLLFILINRHTQSLHSSFIIRSHIKGK